MNQTFSRHCELRAERLELLRDGSVYQENAGRVLGSVVIPRRNQDTFGRDVRDVITRNLKFHEAIDSAGFPIMMQQRLTVMQRELLDQLDCLAFE